VRTPIGAGEQWKRTLVFRKRHGISKVNCVRRQKQDAERQGLRKKRLRQEVKTSLDLYILGILHEQVSYNTSFNWINPS
jgi:hypothetical protein